MRYLTITEFQKIAIGMPVKSDKQNEFVTEADIVELKTMIDSQDNQKIDYSPFLTNVKRGVKATNYVGVIQTESGLSIEVLPKIARLEKTQDHFQKLRLIFINMLNWAANTKYKESQLANVQEANNHLLEMFIQMFTRELDKVIKRGLKSGYKTLTANEKYLKGKLEVGQHIRQNSIDKSAFYITYDTFNHDISENRLIKSTLLMLQRRTKSSSNKRMINRQLLYFDQVQDSKNYKNDFNRVSLTRHHRYYEQLLNWCMLLLNGDSFSPFAGEQRSLVLMFPMESIFETYIAAMLKKKFSHEFRVKIQDSRYTLVDTDIRLSVAKYKLKPDVVLENLKTAEVTIFDTKWKILDTFGPSQSDMYQMFAYYQRYKQKSEKVNEVILLYPLSNDYQENTFISEEMTGENKVKISVKFIDLLQGHTGVQAQLETLLTSKKKGPF